MHSNRDMDSQIKPVIDESYLWFLIDEHIHEVLPKYDWLWEYYRNAPTFESKWAADYSLPQSHGLPERFQKNDSRNKYSREIVIENDINWRVHTLVDFMFGRPIKIESLAADKGQAVLIEEVINEVFETNGGICFFQNLALLGSIYGHVDVLIRGGGAPPFRGTGGIAGMGDGANGKSPSKPLKRSSIIYFARKLVLETIEAPRAIPVLAPHDYRVFDAYLVHYTQLLNEVDHGSFLSRLVDLSGRSKQRRASVDITEIWSHDQVQLYHDQQLVSVEMNTLGVVPVVHIQNIPQPYFYEGLSEVEPLVPLQDELNTRLSDRANRVTMQSFKMYLGKCLEQSAQRTVGPGQMWLTENPDASIDEFGGDASSPSEESHIREIREALDKTSGVTPLAAGLIRGKVGNLTSGNALKIVLMGLLAKTEKKRVTYGKGIEAICELVLRILDQQGVLKTKPSDRRVRIHWPSPLPENEAERLDEAEMKLKIGVSRERVLAELGYSRNEC